MVDHTSEPASEQTMAVVQSFAMHLHTFHETLPAEERVLLEQLITVARAAMAGDTSGYGLTGYGTASGSVGLSGALQGPGIVPPSPINYPSTYTPEGWGPFPTGGFNISDRLPPPLGTGTGKGPFG